MMHTAREFGVKGNHDGGKYHLVANIETETHFKDARYNATPTNDAGLCRALDPQERFPRVSARDSMKQSALCKRCLAKEANLSTEQRNTTCQ